MQISWRLGKERPLKSQAPEGLVGECLTRGHHLPSMNGRKEGDKERKVTRLEGDKQGKETEGRETDGWKEGDRDIILDVT